MPVRVAVLGVAGMGLYHAISVPKVPGYELVAVCDVVADAAERAASQGVQVFHDPGELYASGLADAVVIATPNAMHAEHVRKALAAGLHVYCEKPLGITVGECRELADLARAGGLRVQVGYQNRFAHHYATAHRMISTGELGPLYRSELHATHWFRPDAYFTQRPWRARWETSGGGVLMLQAIHQLDAYAWICGMPSRVLAQTWRTREGTEVEDEAVAICEFADGTRGVILASTADPTGSSRLELHADLGAVVCVGEHVKIGRTPQAVSEISATSTNPFESVGVEWTDLEPDGAPTTFDGLVRACHADFIAAIDEGRDPLNHPGEATKSVELANAVYLSAATGAAVELPLDTAAYDEAFGRLSSGRLEVPGR